MLTHDEMKAWCKMHALVINRLDVLYWVTGERGSIEGRGNDYRVRWRDNLIAEYKCYDMEGVRRAFERVDAVEHFAWEVRRAGLAFASRG